MSIKDVKIIELPKFTDPRGNLSFVEQLNHAQGAMQQLLFPEVLTLAQDEMVLLQQMLPDLQTIGFDVEQLSPDSYSIQGVPSQLANQSVLPVIQYIIEQVRTRGAYTREDWRKQIASALAEQGAIPYGKHLTETEMRDLVKRLLDLPSYRRTEEGKTILSMITNEDIDKRF